MKNSYFTIEELCASDTAKKKKIDNTPNDEVIAHLKELIDFLNPLREAWGSALKVTSGYRCETLNKAVGGSPTSSHMRGYGVDLWPVNKDYNRFVEFLKDYLKDKGFDQCIIEKSGKTRWIHIGLKNSSDKQRKSIFKLNV